MAASDKSDYLFLLLTKSGMRGFIMPTTVSTITGKHLIYFLAMFKSKYHYIPNNLKTPDNIVQNYGDTDTDKTGNCKKLLFDVIKAFQSDTKKKEHLEVLNNTIDNKLLLSNSVIQTEMDATNLLLAKNLDDNKLMEMLNELPPDTIIAANNADKAATDAIKKAIAAPTDRTLQFAAKNAADAAIAAATLAKTAIEAESTRITTAATAAAATDPDKPAIEKAAANYVIHAAAAAAAESAATMTFKTNLNPTIVGATDPTLAPTSAIAPASAVAASAAPAIAVAVPINSTATPTAGSAAVADVAAAAKKRGEDLAGFINAAPATDPSGDPQKLVAPAQRHQTTATSKQLAYRTTPTITTALGYQAAAQTAVDTLNNIIGKLPTSTSPTAIYYKSSIATLKKIQADMNTLLADAKSKVADEALNQDNALISGAATAAALSATAATAAAVVEAKNFLNNASTGDSAWVTKITSTTLDDIKNALMTLAQSVHTETINIERGTDPTADKGRYGKAQTTADTTAGREPAELAVGEPPYQVGAYEWKIPPNGAAGTEDQQKRKTWRDFRINRWKLNDNKLKFILNDLDILLKAKTYYSTIPTATSADLTTQKKLNIFNDINNTRNTYFTAINKIVDEKNSNDPGSPAATVLAMYGGGKQYNKKTFKNKQFKRKQTHRNNYFHRTRMHRKQKHRNQTHKK